MFHCVNIPQIIYLLHCWWVFWCSQLFGVSTTVQLWIFFYLSFDEFVYLFLIDIIPVAWQGAAQIKWHQTTIISLYSWILWVGNLDRAQKVRFVSAPPCLGSQMGKLRRLGSNSMARGWNHVNFSLTYRCLGWNNSMAGLSWDSAPEYLSTTSPWGLGFLTVWWPPVVRLLTWGLEVLRASILAAKWKL